MRSLLHPGVMLSFPYMISSATRPPIATSMKATSSSFVCPYLSSSGKKAVNPKACPLDRIVTLSRGLVFWVRRFRRVWSPSCVVLSEKFVFIDVFLPDSHRYPVYGELEVFVNGFRSLLFDCVQHCYVAEVLGPSVSSGGSCDYFRVYFRLRVLHFIEIVVQNAHSSFLVRVAHVYDIVKPPRPQNRLVQGFYLVRCRRYDDVVRGDESSKMSLPVHLR